MALYRLVGRSKVLENYGAHRWDDRDGPCPQEWRYKQGHDYLLAIAMDEDAKARTDADAVVQAANRYLRGDDYFMEQIEDYVWLREGELTEHQQLLLRYGGFVPSLRVIR